MAKDLLDCMETAVAASVAPFHIYTLKFYFSEAKRIKRKWNEKKAKTQPSENTESATRRKRTTLPTKTNEEKNKYFLIDVSTFWIPLFIGSIRNIRIV